MGFSVSLKAQSNLAKPLFLKTNSSSFLVLPEKENSISMFLPSIKHTAFFCVMEDKVYNKLNVWIKLRAGSDEIYRKMIATP
jgi:hypothetical protein